MLLQNPIKIVIISLAVIFIIAGTTVTQNKSLNQSWFFIHITDPQFGMFENNGGFEKETYLYEKAVERINNLQPDFVVITGDFVHNSNSLEQIEEFKRITAKIDPEIPVYFTPGNHDIGQNPEKQSLKRYKKNYGSDRFVFKHHGSVFIGINTSFIKAQMHRSEQKQYQWLSEKLKKSQKADHIIVFCHYPFFNTSVDEPEAYSNIGPVYREKYLSLFQSKNVNAVFSGHYHNNSLSYFGKV